MVPARAVERQRPAVGAIDDQPSAGSEVPDLRHRHTGGGSGGAEPGCMPGRNRREHLVVRRPGAERVRVAGRTVRRSPVRSDGSLVQQLLHPSESPLPA